MMVRKEGWRVGKRFSVAVGAVSSSTELAVSGGCGSRLVTSSCIWSSVIKSLLCWLTGTSVALAMVG